MQTMEADAPCRAAVGDIVSPALVRLRPAARAEYRQVENIGIILAWLLKTHVLKFASEARQVSSEREGTRQPLKPCA
jgi:hypothetical protein